jgi:glycosyltransferase involved in cell wall biosynthesis
MGAAAPVVSIMRWVEGVALRNAAQVLAISDGVAEQLSQFGVSPGRVSVVGNGIDTDTFDANGPREQPGHPYFVYTGTMSEWQGAEIFIEALKELEEENVRLYFFGQGASETKLRGLAEQMVPGRVTFGGVKSPEETASWIRGATGALVSIVPGQGYDFAKPTKIYAAAACGTPVIYAGVGDSAAMVSENHLGESVAYDPLHVADAMRRLLNDGADDRELRITWVNKNASLRSAGERAAAAVLSARL